MAADTAITPPVLEIFEGFPTFKITKVLTGIAIATALAFLTGAAIGTALASWLTPFATAWWPKLQQQVAKAVTTAAATMTAAPPSPSPVSRTRSSSTADLSAIPAAQPAARPPPPPPSAADRLAKAEAALFSATPGSEEWRAALASAADLAKLPDLAPAQRNRFWGAVQESYQQQTKTVTSDFWWDKSEPDKGKPSAQDVAWLATSRALASQGSWLAATYEARAIASRRGGVQTNVAQANTARANLAKWANSPEFGPFPALSAARQLEVQLEIAQLLTDLALLEAHVAKSANQAIPAAPTAQLLPLLETLSAVPSQQGQLLLGLVARCLKQPPDASVAQAEFRKAARPGAGTDSKVFAADAQTWLDGKNTCY